MPFESLSTNSLACYSPPVTAGRRVRREPRMLMFATVGAPQAGVWEITVEARRTSDVAHPAPFTLTVAILGASVAPNPDALASVMLGFAHRRAATG